MTDLPNDPTAPSDQPTSARSEDENQDQRDVLNSDPTASDNTPEQESPEAPRPVPPHPNAPRPTAQQVPPERPAGPRQPQQPWQGQSAPQPQQPWQGQSAPQPQQPWQGQSAPQPQQPWQGQSAPQPQQPWQGQSAPQPQQPWQGQSAPQPQQPWQGQSAPQPQQPWQGQSGQQGQSNPQGQQPPGPGQFDPQNPGQFGPQGQQGQFGPQGQPGQFGQQGFGGQQPWQGQSGGYPGGSGQGPYGPGGPGGPPQGGLKWWYIAIPVVVVILILALVLGLRSWLGSDDPATTTGPTRSVTQAPNPNKTSSQPTSPRTSTSQAPGKPGTPGQPAAGTVTPLKDPKKVRFEVFASSNGTVDVRYGSDNKDTKDLDKQQTPFAVEAALTPSNNYLSVAGSDYEGTGSIMCRIYLDDVLVFQDVGKQFAHCSLLRDQASETRATGKGAALGAVTTVAPKAGAAPALPAAPATAKFELLSSAPGGSVDIRYGTDDNKLTAVSAKTPYAVQAPLAGTGSYLVLSASDYSAQAAPYLACRMYVDGVLVHVQQQYRSVTCLVSKDALTGD